MSILDPTVDDPTVDPTVTVPDPTVPTVFVPHRVLRRVIKQHASLGGLGLRVPHDECLALPAERLRGLRDGAGIPIPGGASQVVLVPEPDPDVRAALGPDEALRRLWRLLYHAHLDAHLNERVPDYAEKLVLERVHAIGQTEFDEIRLVLRQERRVLPPEGDAAVYREFAALFLELRAFAPHLVDHTFPVLERPAAVEAILALDVDALALLEATRPEGAPSSPRGPDAPDPEPLDAEDLDAEPPEAPASPRVGGAPRPWSKPLAAAPVRNLVREAISARRRGEDGDDALRALAAAIHVAVGAAGPSPAEWARALGPALERSGRTLRPEARLLFDVQTAAHEHAKDVFTADLVGWALSRGRRPIARPLPVQRRFRVLRALHRAQRRVPSLGLPAADGQRLSRAMDVAVSACESGIREELRPRLLAALDEVGLVPRNLPERVAQAKMLDELLDRLIARGFLHLGDVRDAISRNQLKLRDLSGAREAWTGDAMLRLNRRLADELDGVYRGAEIYLRGMQRLSALTFGTPAGRTVTLFGLLPFGGAFVILEGLQHMIGPALGWLTGSEPRLSSPMRLLSLGLFLVLLIHSPHARDAARWLLSLTGRVLRWSLVETPRWVLSLPPVQRVLKSRPVRLLVRRLLRPLLLAALLWWVFPAAGAGWLASALAGVALFGAFNVLLNSRWGRVLEEATADAVIVAWERLRHAILPGLFRLVLDVFERLLSELERVLYAVDEQLRFREGQGRVAFVAKAVGGVIWFGATWLVRLCVNVLVEPQINPIKHFPVVTVSHKVMLGLIPMFAQWVSPLFDGDMKEATIFVGSVVWLIPGAFGYLAWELKENWRLFAANRPPTLRPARIGSHGETLLRLMRPGFHSGTLPKLFARLRRADRGLRGQRDTKAILKAQAGLQHVEEAVRSFVERELVALLSASGALAGGTMHVGRVRLASNRIRVELILDGEPDTALIGFEEQSGRVVANVARSGFLGALPSPERFARALAGLYALCGVDLVREQIALALPPGARYDIAAGGLLVWLHGDVVPWTYDLRRRRMVPRRPGARGGPPALEARHVRFGATPIRWDDWVDAWEGAQDPVPVHGPVLPRARVAARLREPAAGGSC